MSKIEISSKIDFSRVFEIVKDKELPGEIIYDLKDYTFFEPLDILLFTMPVIYLKAKGGLQKILYPNIKGTKTYLDSIGLLDFFKTNYQEPTTIQWIPSLSAMPLRRLTTVTMNNYISLVQSYFSNYCKGKDLTFLNLAISELINNVSDHACSIIDAYVFCQYYPRLNSIKVAVGDLGIGIPEAVNNYRSMNNLIRLNDKEALNWALSENASTKTKPHNRGKGLSNLLGFIKANNNNMSIYSNSTWVRVIKDKLEYLDNPIHHFKGTIVEMEISIASLPEIDNIVDDFWEQSQF